MSASRSDVETRVRARRRGRWTEYRSGLALTAPHAGRAACVHVRGDARACVPVHRACERPRCVHARTPIQELAVPSMHRSSPCAHDSPTARVTTYASANTMPARGPGLDRGVALGYRRSSQTPCPGQRTPAGLNARGDTTGSSTRSLKPRRTPRASHPVRASSASSPSSDAVVRRGASRTRTSEHVLRSRRLARMREPGHCGTEELVAQLFARSHVRTHAHASEEKVRAFLNPNLSEDRVGRASMGAEASKGQARASSR
ncbi:hypothetical protein K488DRAFT_67303 [Vararia minispora EC-137]|uniref:Uncharacterized protein n=1 Tax=Vararia minispora EC-137 TaxID=1314806 RepID=A0ACB8R062_9AGAM|nr:hypothetical protein K488DRAFT_67303 [Vararia minispora EC-137]